MNYMCKTLNIGSTLENVDIIIKNIGFVPDELIIKSIAYTESSAIADLTSQRELVRQLWTDMIDEGILCTMNKKITYIQNWTLNNGATYSSQIYTLGETTYLDTHFQNNKNIDNRTWNFQIQQLKNGYTGNGDVIETPTFLSWSVMIEFRKYTK